MSQHCLQARSHPMTLCDALFAGSEAVHVYGNLQSNFVSIMSGLCSSMTAARAKEHSLDQCNIKSKSF